MQKADVSAWEETAEDLHARLSDEYFRLEVGLSYSKGRIASLERLNRQHAGVFLKNFSAPRALFLDSIASVAKAKTFGLTLKLHELRKSKICTRVGRTSVSWTTWRQFASHASDAQRKSVFDAFIKKSGMLTPTIDKFFRKSSGVYAAHGVDPLGVYLEDHHLTAAQLRNFLLTLGNSVKGMFRAEFRKYAKKFLQRSPAYYDDYYFMRNVVFSDMTDGFPVDSRDEVCKLLRDLGFDPRLIAVDDADRPSKYPSPFCSFVRIPHDVRVSYKPENPLQTAIALYHEFGHAAHAITIDAGLPYHKRYVLSEGLTETFSIFLENVLSDEDYLLQVLNLDKGYARELVQRIRFTEHFAIAFYVANSLLKMDQWEQNLSLKQMNDHYSMHLKTWLGMDVPGEYWQLHHILPESLMYVPSYLLAMARAHELTELLKKEYGRWWWANKRAGEELRAVMRPGADSKVGDFSTLDVASYVKSL
ncbi:hypothetical protein HY490_00985 [Candidatus Woesearchaeota archaeon]|nr:hypothetical protein [Candidatus Woesearchaeota archaeon]